MSKGILIVLSGPSGSGKDSMLQMFTHRGNDCYLSISATTREPRIGEKDGKNYHFITRSQFEKLIENDGFIEYAEYVGNYYGTLKAPVAEALRIGKDVILEIETKGAFNVKKQFPEAVLVFVTVPSIEELRKRLTGRGTDSPEVVERRLKKAEEEMKLISRYQYTVVNDTLEHAVEQLEKIIKTEKEKTQKGANRIC